MFNHSLELLVALDGQAARSWKDIKKTTRTLKILMDRLIVSARPLEARPTIAPKLPRCLADFARPVALHFWARRSVRIFWTRPSVPMPELSVLATDCVSQHAVLFEEDAVTSRSRQRMHCTGGRTIEGCPRRGHHAQEESAAAFRRVFAFSSMSRGAELKVISDCFRTRPRCRRLRTLYDRGDNPKHGP